MQTEHIIHTVEDWRTFACTLLTGLKTPVIFALSGPLGAGKTTFVQALAMELGVVDRPRSPTFSLLRTYVLPSPREQVKRLVHIDAYRLETAADVYALDLEGELAESGTIVALEWPERVGDALHALGVKIINIKIQVSDTGRIVQMT